jgi:hypothetical protein
MHVWAKRDYQDRSYSYALEQMTEQHAAAGRPQGMMMVGTTRSEDRQMTTIYIRLPDPVLLVTYPDFVRIDERDLPEKARLLFGEESEFRKYFRRSIL